jgi:predicted dienelactone hydrolase
MDARIAPALLMAGALCAALPAARAAEPAPFNAGMRMGAIPYRQVSMPIALTYPTRSEAALRDFGPYRMTIAMGASAAPAPAAGWPLVFVSHGTGGSLLGHADLVAALARAGYVVVMLEHPGDNYRDRSLVADARYFSERPAQLRALLQAFLDRDGAAGAAAGGLLGDLRIDASRVALIGHSAGGYTVPVVAGASGNVQRDRSLRRERWRRSDVRTGRSECVGRPWHGGTALPAGGRRADAGERRRSAGAGSDPAGAADRALAARVIGLAAPGPDGDHRGR